MDTLTSELKAHNLKLTPQRLAVYSYLKAVNSHPSVEQIYDDLKDSCPKMSIATVYKTVASLSAEGLIQKLAIGDTCRYDGNTAFHIHAVCTCCNNVYDCDNDIFSELMNDIKGKIGFESEYGQLFMYGKCSNCK